LVRINRLKDGRTCNVSVTADDNTLEALQDAKEKAVAIAREINDPLNSELVEGAPEELAF
jgi:hypothetical protein